METVYKKYHFQSKCCEQGTKEVLQRLFLSAQFSDVTLVCDDGYYLSAHRNILSASSDFFRAIFQKNPHPNNLIVMDNADQNILKSILQFIYTGQAEIWENDLQDFLRFGRKFKLDGLSDDNDVNEKEDEYIEKETVKQELIDEDFTKIENEMMMIHDDALTEKVVDEKNVTVDASIEASISESVNSIVEKRGENCNSSKREVKVKKSEENGKNYKIETNGKKSRREGRPELIDEEYTQIENESLASRKEMVRVNKGPIEMNIDKVANSTEKVVDEKNLIVDASTEAEMVDSNEEKCAKESSKREGKDKKSKEDGKNYERESKEKKGSSYSEWYESVQKRNRDNYSCDQCIFVANSKASLKEHTEYVHNFPNNPCKCNICGEKFSHISSLSHHKRNVHEKKVYKMRR